jgi:hypothetical protein
MKLKANKTYIKRPRIKIKKSKEYELKLKYQ